MHRPPTIDSLRVSVVFVRSMCVVWLRVKTAVSERTFFRATAMPRASRAQTEINSSQSLCSQYRLVCIVDTTAPASTDTGENEQHSVSVHLQKSKTSAPGSNVVCRPKISPNREELLQVREQHITIHYDDPDRDVGRGRPTTTSKTSLKSV